MPSRLLTESDPVCYPLGNETRLLAGRKTIWTVGFRAQEFDGCGAVFHAAILTPLS